MPDELIYRHRQSDRMLPLVRAALFVAAGLFTAYAAWELALGGDPLTLLPWRLTLTALMSTLALATRLPVVRRHPVAFLHIAAATTSVGIAALATQVPEQHVFAVGSYLLVASVLPVVATRRRVAVTLSVGIAIAPTVLMPILGTGRASLLMTLFFLIPALGIAIVLAWIREEADRAQFVLERTLHEERERLAVLARTDALTGTRNRHSFFETATPLIELAERHARPLSVLLLDVDHFKRINDTHGHAVGDTTLRMLVATVERTLRETDVFGRLGGEEFAVVLPETDMQGALLLAERLRAACARTEVLAEGRTIRFTVSAGVAVARKGDTLAALLHRADEGLYAAKRTGRDRVIAA